MKDLINDPQKLWQIAVVSSAAIPVIVIFVRWFWNKSKTDVKAAIITDLKQNNDEFKQLMHEQMTVVKATVEVVKDSVDVMKRDNELNHKQSELNHQQSEQMMELMTLHIDELKHVKGKVDDHEDRIVIIEKMK